MRRLAVLLLFAVIPFTVLGQDSAGNQIKIDAMNDRMRGRTVQMQEGTAKPTGRMVNVADVLKKTDEMNKLVLSVNGDMAGLSKGMLAADLTTKLKKIEKLAKDLRHSLE
jgi:hypothetical protein